MNLTPQEERKGEMSWFKSNGFPSPFAHPGEEQSAAPESVSPLAPMQPFDEVQPLPVEPAQEPFRPLHPLESARLVESFSVHGVEPAQLQPIEPLLALEPTMPQPQVSAPPVPKPEKVANLGVPLGTLIFRAGLLTEEQLEDALQEGVRSGKRLGEVLLESGLLDERDLGRLLADQKGLRFVELSGFAHDPSATSLLSAEKAHMFAALPVGFEDGLPLVAVADPSNELVTENLRRALGEEPRLVVASRSDLHATIDRLHATPGEEPAAEAQPEFAVAEPVLEPVAPALSPVQVAHVEVAQPETNGYTTVAPPVTPEPAPVAPEPEPVAVEPQPGAVEPEAVTVEPLVAEPVAAQPLVVEPDFPEPVASVTPEDETSFSGIADEPAQDAEPEFPTALSYSVSLRLTDGERVQIGSFGEPQKAREYAREVVRHLSHDNEGWPFFSGRFMRPDTIVSVDIAPVGEPERWLGSAARSNWASRLNR